MKFKVNIIIVCIIFMLLGILLASYGFLINVLKDWIWSHNIRNNM